MFKFQWVDKEVTTKERGIKVEVEPPSIGNVASLVSGLFSSSSSQKKIRGSKKSSKKSR